MKFPLWLRACFGLSKVSRPNGSRRAVPLLRLRLEQLEDRTVPTTLVQQVAAINPGAFSAIANGVNLNGTLYFTATDGVNGNALWKSDGTAAGTVLVKAINPGNLTVVGSRLFFTAFDGGNGTGLWQSDGTSAGTVLVKDFSSDNLSNLTNLNGTLYFYDANTSAIVIDLAKSDGTAAGTVDVVQIAGGMAEPTPSNLTTAGSTLFFVVGGVLHKSDGTAAGTVLVKNFNSTFLSQLDSTNANGVLFFAANDGVSGEELWKSDGTAAGTVLVKDINPGPNGSNPSGFTTVGNTVFFSADDGTHGNELWKSDGTAAGTILVKDIDPGADSSRPIGLTALGNTVFFAAFDGTDGNELWKSDGTAAGTVLVKDINPGTANSNPTYLTAVGSTLFFAANDGTHGTELWQSDGTAAGTVLAKDINPGAADSNPVSLTAVGSTLFFAANDTTTSQQLWSARITSGTPAPSSADELGAYRASNGSWSLDSDGTSGFNAATDQVIFSFSPANVIGVAGDWTGSGISKVGDFSNGTWHLDLNNNGVLDPGETFQFGQAGNQPVVGDWTGSGVSNIGVFRTAPDGITGEFILDTNGDHVMDAGDETFTFGLGTDRIVIGDWNGGGKDEVGVFRDAVSFIPADVGDAVFSLDTNNNHTFDAGDQVFVFGLITDKVVIGDWNGSGTSKVGVYRDGSTASGSFSSLDAPGTALFSLDYTGKLMFDSTSEVFLYGLTSDQFVTGHWAKTPPLQPEGTPQAQFAANGPGSGGVAPLTEAQLEPVLQQAILNWEAQGANAAQLESVPVQIGQLNNNLVGLTSGDQITIDATADGWGWNTDTSNADFTSASADGLQAAPGSLAAGQMDLLTVVEHELGHELGLSDVAPATHPSDLMAATLPTGTRRFIGG